MRNCIAYILLHVNSFMIGNILVYIIRRIDVLCVYWYVWIGLRPDDYDEMKSV